MIIALTILAANILLYCILWEFAMRPYAVEVLKHQLSNLRHTLFMQAVVGNTAFNSFQYTILQKRIDRMIASAAAASFSDMLFVDALIRRYYTKDEVEQMESGRNEYIEHIRYEPERRLYESLENMRINVFAAYLRLSPAALLYSVGTIFVEAFKLVGQSFRAVGTVTLKERKSDRTTDSNVPLEPERMQAIIVSKWVVKVLSPVAAEYVHATDASSETQKQYEVTSPA